MSKYDEIANKFKTEYKSDKDIDLVLKLLGNFVRQTSNALKYYTKREIYFR